MTRSKAPLSNDLLDAALAFAARGWPVFPCNNANKQPLLAADKDPKTGVRIKGTGGVSKASCDPKAIRAWWGRWPFAMIGLATGHGRLFVVDFDPRHDPETGEEFTLERLKGELEAQIGCALPATLAVRTQSGGVHLYFLWPDDGGAEIRNRGNLPRHVDVRGAGGYVIAPPSVMEDGNRYRWLHGLGPGEVEIVGAPAALVEILRSSRSGTSSRGGGEEGSAPADKAAPSSPLRQSSALPDDPEGSAIRRYALAALDDECRELAATPIGGGRWGGRNNGIYHSALQLGTLVGAGALSESAVRAALGDVVRAMPHNDDLPGALQTLENGLAYGLAHPRDLSEIAEAARRRSSRPPSHRASGSPAAGERSSFRPGRQDGHSAGGRGAPADSEPLPEPLTGSHRSNTSMGPLTAAERARFERLSKAWLERRVEHVEPTAKALTALAWSAGRRVAAGLLDLASVKEALWPVYEDLPDVRHADIDRALEDGIARGFDPGPLRLTFRCAAYPLTDFGLGERFRDRHGADFRFTTGKGWLGWDGRRWKVLDQDKETPPAELVAAMFETVRAVQLESKAVADTGVRWGLVKRKVGRKEVAEVDQEDEGNPHGLDRWVPKGAGFVRFSEMLATFGRQSELAGKPVAIANLARRWLTVPIEDFDCEQLAINVLNGTLRFAVETLGDGTRRASRRLDPHRREDLITKLAPVAFDPEAPCPLYDGMFGWAQPRPAERRYLHQVGGYAATGDTGEHKLWFNYGRGRNGKSTTIDSWCAALGDYSGTIGIESFLDQGIKKRGDQATPDLAKLGGVRMLRASEPDRDAKLNSALIKAATGGEPMSVRALHRGFFDLLPRFKLLMSGNSKPSIPDTDDGIWGRMKLVPWKRNIEKPDEDPFAREFPESAASWPAKDTKLGEKIKAGELPGVFNRLVEGLMDWLANGFVEPTSISEATQAYRDASDPLARFLRLCTAADPSGRIQSSKLHEVFVAWCKAAGEKEWSNKGLSNAMVDKGFVKKASDGMQWLGLRLVRQAEDFVDEHGRVKALPDDLAEAPPNEGDGPLWPARGGAPPPALPGDDFVPGFDDDPGLPV